jgi:hypothetical protein
MSCPSFCLKELKLYWDTNIRDLEMMTTRYFKMKLMQESKHLPMSASRKEKAKEEEEGDFYNHVLVHNPHHFRPRQQQHPWPLQQTREKWNYCVEISENSNNFVNEVDPQRYVAVVTTSNIATPYLPSEKYLKVLSTLQKYSAIASWLCLIDCTILPILTLIIPLLGVANLGSERLQFVHSMGDFTTLYVLLPVGSLSTILNYTSSPPQHRSMALLGAMGVILVALANSYSLPGVGHVQVFHFLHQGLWHRVVNLWGCLCLLVSNQWTSHYRRHSRSNSKKTEDRCCVIHEKSNKPLSKDFTHGYSRHRRRQFWLAKSKNDGFVEGRCVEQMV